MSKAIAQSATKLAVSGNTEENFDFASSCERASERTVKNATREHQMLNRQKLISTVCADYRVHFPSIYGKTDRLPAEVFDKIETAVDTFLTKQLSRVNKFNAVSYKRQFAFSAKDLSVYEKEILTGHNVLAMREQKLGIEIFITSAEKRLKELEAKPTPDYDAEKAMKVRLMQLNVARDFIMAELSKQEKLASETKQ